MKDLTYLCLDIVARVNHKAEGGWIQTFERKRKGKASHGWRISAYSPTCTDCTYSICENAAMNPHALQMFEDPGKFGDYHDKFFT